VKRGIEGAFFQQQIAVGRVSDPAQQLESVHAVGLREATEGEELDGSG
jgi:hypothetical protein